MTRGLLIRRDGGFALPLVVFLLFAVTTAGAASYLMVQAEFSAVTLSGDNEAALAIARGGIQRFVAEQQGEPDDTVEYALGNGIVTVTATKMAEEDSTTHLYYIRAEAEIENPGRPGAPTRRVVGAYGKHNLSPVKHKAAWLMAVPSVYVFHDTDVDGTDDATVGECPSATGGAVTGVIATSYIYAEHAGHIVGSPASQLYSSIDAVKDSSGIRWDVLSDPSYPVEHDGVWPSFGSIPSDSFPVIRRVGSLGVSSAASGRGVLIVTGTLYMWSGFEWDGIILAGDLYPTVDQDVTIKGMVVGGLNGATSLYYAAYKGKFDYHSCNVANASRSLSYFELVDNSMFEVW